MDRETLQGALPAYFAPWVQALGLQVEAFDEGSVTLRLPQNGELSRVGGMLCGQAMMAAADTAMVLALINQWGAFRPCTTVQMNTSFLKPLAGQTSGGRRMARVLAGPRRRTRCCRLALSAEGRSPALRCWRIAVDPHNSNTKDLLGGPGPRM